MYPGIDFGPKNRPCGQEKESIYLYGYLNFMVTLTYYISEQYFLNIQVLRLGDNHVTC